MNYEMVYDGLVDICGAPKSMRRAFMNEFSDYDIKSCIEWRFGGKLGYGGKYYPRENLVGYYLKDETPERDYIVKCTNEFLMKLWREMDDKATRNTTTFKN